VPLGATVIVAGVTAMETSCSAVTVSVVVPVMPPEEAEMVLLPAATPVARPETLIVATEAVADNQLAAAVRSFVVPSLYVPVAVNCCVAPVAIVGADGATAMEISVAAGGGVGPDPEPPELPPQPTNRLTPSNKTENSNLFICIPQGSRANYSARAEFGQTLIRIICISNHKSIRILSRPYHNSAMFDSSAQNISIHHSSKRTKTVVMPVLWRGEALVPKSDRVHK
jgi:hypothetical protein